MHYKTRFPILLLLITSTFSFIGQTKLSDSFFNDANTFFGDYVIDKAVKYEFIKSEDGISSLIDQVKTMDISEATDTEKKAFYINAYNLYVINLVIKHAPILSVKDVNGFFDSKKITVASESMTLNSLEKNKLLVPTKDPRLHFVLVCGAKGCPPIINRAYLPATLDQQLSAQTALALDDPAFIKTTDSKTEVSQIFNWYASDFGSTRENIIKFINTYKTNKLPVSTKLKYYEYDWILNEYSTDSTDLDTPQGNNAIRYVVSSTIPVGSSELKIFNNLYTEVLDGRSNFFTTSFSYLYGVKRKLNLGVSIRYRRVRNDSKESSPFAVLGPKGDAQVRQGITNVGPQVRWAPVEKWGNFSIQSQFLIPTGKDQTGFKTGAQYIDYSRPSWITQFFNDKSIGNSFSIFTEIDASFEGIGLAEGASNRVTFPMTAILSYFPHAKFTVYGLTNFTPAINIPFDFYYQVGTGAKYQITRNFEVEVLYNVFRNRYQLQNNGTAETFNMGIRASF